MYPFLRILQKLTLAGSGNSNVPMASRPGLTADELRPVAHAFYAELSAPSLISLFDKVSA